MYRSLMFGILVSLMAFFPPMNMGHAGLALVDTDGDGWSDAFEQRLNTDPQSKGSYPSSIEDPDRDGLTNVEERAINTDPLDPDSDGDYLSDGQEVLNRHTDPLNSDTDRDGSSDFFEVLDGTKPHIPDSDGDDWLDGAERKAGSDPLDLSSTP